MNHEEARGERRVRQDVEAHGSSDAPSLDPDDPVDAMPSDGARAADRSETLAEPKPEAAARALRGDAPGAGGMGVVYETEDTRSRGVALKVLSKRFARREGGLAPPRGAGAAAVTIQHRRDLRRGRSGRRRVHRDGARVGATLRARMRGRMRVDAALDVACEIARGSRGRIKRGSCTAT
jgi:hypothetical protein